MIISPSNRKRGCSRKKKSPCLEAPHCNWVVGKGCKSNVAVSPSVNKPLSNGCSRKKKSPCLEAPHCNWVVGKGCKSDQNFNRNPVSSKKVVKKTPISHTLPMDLVDNILGFIELQQYEFVGLVEDNNFDSFVIYMNMYEIPDEWNYTIWNAILDLYMSDRKRSANKYVDVMLIYKRYPELYQAGLLLTLVSRKKKRHLMQLFKEHYSKQEMKDIISVYKDEMQ